MLVAIGVMLAPGMVLKGLPHAVRLLSVWHMHVMGMADKFK